MTGGWDDEAFRRLLSNFDRPRTPADDERARIRARMLSAFEEASVAGPVAATVIDLDVPSVVVDGSIPTNAARRRSRRVLAAAAVIVVAAVATALVVGLRPSGEDDVTVASPVVERVTAFCEGSLPDLVDAWRVVEADGDLLVAANLDRVIESVEADLADLLAQLRGGTVDSTTVDRIDGLTVAARGTFDAGQLARTAELVEALRLEVRLVLAAPNLPGGTSCDTIGL